MRDSGHDKLIIENKLNICNNCIYFHHECYGYDAEELENEYCTEECKYPDEIVNDRFDEDNKTIHECVGFKSNNN